MEKATNTLLGMVKSKTVWFNVLFLLVLVANQFGFSEFSPDEIWLVVGNIITRLLTTQPLWQK